MAEGLSYADPVSHTLKFIPQGFVFFLEFCYLHFKYCYLFVPIISNKLKVLNSIIIPNMILMMHDFPSVKAMSKTFSHY